MRKLCPTCFGKGSIPDPKLTGMPLGYVGPNGEGCPSVFCQSCGASGWVEEEHRCHCCPHEKHVAPTPPGSWPQSGGLIPPGQSSISIYETSVISTF